MAHRDLPGQELFLASSNLAGETFNSTGTHPIRQKHLFIVRFMRYDEEHGGHGDTGHVVKQMDRPQVQPVLEELNQYNKKRQIQTGIKYQPVNCTFYDTADGAALNMWHDYARYHFGDYTQTPDAYFDDIINDKMNDPSGYGYGFTIPDYKSTDSINSQFFFSKVRIYQVWANEYISYELVNSRIANFTPDELSYETGDVGTISMTLNYESVYHYNDGRPQTIDGNSWLRATLGSLVGGAYDIQSVDSASVPAGFAENGRVPIERGAVTPAIPPVEATNEDLTRRFLERNGIGVGRDLEYIAPTTKGGTLERFGDFDLGLSLPRAANRLDTEFDLGRSNVLQPALGQKNANAAPSYVLQGISAASYLSGTTGLEQVSKDGGIQLSSGATALANASTNGTTYIGHRRG